MTEHIENLKTALAERYAIEREIGAGGMATVYLAQDVRHDRQVAVKVLRPELAAILGPDRFLREIQIAARLQHPHILTLIDSGEAGGFLYFVMPYIKGESLREKLLHGELPIAGAVKILRDVTAALNHAHSEGLVHRDIKPDNVLLSGDYAVVTDFGVAKAVSDATGDEKLTTAGVALGTPMYMAPEQAMADPNTDHRADIYALGVLGYEMLAGKPPFDGKNPQAILAAHVTEVPIDVTQHRSSVPQPLSDLIMRCLEKKAADRWQDTAELLQQLETIATPSGGITPTDTRPLAAAKPNKGKSRFVLAVLAAVAIIAGFAWLAKKIPTSNVVLNDNLVVVLPFRVSGGEQLDYLGEGVVDLFQGTLTGEGGPRAVSSQSAIGAWKRRGGSADNDLIEEEALALARSLGAGLLLQGSVVGSPNNIILNASILAVDGSGEPIHATVSGNIDSVAVLTGRLTAQLISLQAGEESQTASNLTGISLPALREYLQGQIAFREGRFEDALTGYGRALAVDSTFALAALGHSISASWVVTAPNSPGIRIAWENQEQLSPRDKLLLEAWAPPPGAVRSIAETIAINERVAVTLQDRHEAWYLLGDRIFHLGQSVGMSHDQQFDRAWGAFQQALNLAPNFGPILKHKFDYAFWEEDTEYLLALADSFPEFVASTPDVALAIALATNDSAAVHQWMEEIPQHSINDLAVSTTKLFRAGWEDETFQIFDRAASRPTSTANRRGGLGYKWDLLTMAGRPQAAATLRDEMRTEFGPPPPYVLGFTLKNALFMNGDTVQAIQALNELEQHNSGAIAQEEYAVIDQAVAACYSGTWYAARQQTDEALHMRARLREISDRFQDAFVNDYAVPCLMQLDLLLADPADLPEILQAADSVSLTGGPFEGIDLNLFNVLLARAFELQGMPERALAVSRRRLATGGPEQQMMLLYEGRLSAQTGDTLGAIRAYDLYLRVRDGAEPEVRAMDDAVRADLARLVGERPGPR